MAKWGEAVKEEALLLGPHKSLVGVYTPPAADAVQTNGNCAVVLFNAGLIHHVGPQRLHVRLARALAERGAGALRVDFSGIGDSSVRPDNLPAQTLVAQEPTEILDDLVRRGHDSFVLFGICSGAARALQAALAYPHVKGLILVNVESPGEDAEKFSQASAQYYMRRSLWNPRAWLNLFTGRVKYKALFQALVGEVRRRLSGSSRNQKTLADVVLESLAPILARETKLLILLSDRHAQLAKLMGDGLHDLQRSGQLQIGVYPEADHLFTSLKEQELLVERVCLWFESLQRGA